MKKRLALLLAVFSIALAIAVPVIPVEQAADSSGFQPLSHGTGLD